MDAVPVTVKFTGPLDVTVIDAGVTEAMPAGNDVGANTVAVPENPFAKVTVTGTVVVNPLYTAAGVDDAVKVNAGEAVTLCGASVAV